ncbi:MAG: NfeD family protein [Ruminococcus sp.]|nr:NfeD family protein [Oscillospiraceae bacterium]MDY4414640.1 NfeD family protein [Ruminococcus sp.]
MTLSLLLWASVIIIAVIIEAGTFQFISVWFALGGIVALIADIAGASFGVQFALFTVSSVIFLIIGFPLGRKLADFKKTSTNFEMNIGKTATVIEEINSAQSTGRVRLNGVDWIAVSADGSIIPKDSAVVVSEIKGTKLTVALKDTAKVS